MRLCWNDSFGGPLGGMKLADAQFVRKLGYEVAGINAGVTEALGTEIDHAKQIFEEVGLTPGPYGISASAVRPDNADQTRQKKQLAGALNVAGRLGCSTLRYSVGSMHPSQIWMHHPDNGSQKAMDELVKNTKDLIPAAEDANCILCPETTQFTIVNTVERMKEYVDRCDSPWVRIIFDPVNHMNAQRVYDSGAFIISAIGTLGDRIGVIHVKDVKVQDKLLIVHVDEAEMGTGLLDHVALIKASNLLAPWKTFSLEHISDHRLITNAHHHIQKVADSIGHKWDDPKLTREKHEKGGLK